MTSQRIFKITYEVGGPTRGRLLIEYRSQKTIIEAGKYAHVVSKTLKEVYGAAVRVETIEETQYSPSELDQRG